MSNDYAGNVAFLRSLTDGPTPDPLITVAEWAHSYRILSGRAAAEAGRYRTSRKPFMREIMENLSPSCPVERVVFMKAAQTGATEAGSNFFGFVIPRRRPHFGGPANGQTGEVQFAAAH